MRVWKLIPILKPLARLTFIALLTGLALIVVKSVSLEEIEIKRVEESLLDSGQPVLALSANEKEVIFESAVFKAQIQFNAIALHWKEENVTKDEFRRVFIRASLNKIGWEDWMELESLGPLRDDEPHSDRIFPEIPILVNGRFFQYKVVIKRDNLDTSSPHLSDLRATYIDSRTPAFRKIFGNLKNLISPAEAAEQGPNIVYRAAWGSPDPYGTLFSGTEQHWYPRYDPVKQFFVHHTAIKYTADPAAAVRAIWEFHTYTRGWGDIGYNYLIDQQGNIYEGRFGGDNVEGGHVLGFNRGSLGVAVLGCFETTSGSCTGAPPPSSEMINGLTNLLAWKSDNFEINPNTTQTFCGTSSCLNIWTISGHKDAAETACPGNLIYNQFQTVREQTWNKKGSWGYSAKQIDFESVSFNNYETDKSVTIRFKNTGTTTWSNTTNRILLKTANPDGRTSIFQGAGWVDAQTPSMLSEANVAPGGTGSFTFNIKSPNGAHGYYFENFRLVSEGNASLPQMFGLVVLPPSYRWEFLGVSHSTGKVQMASGEAQTITLWAKNVGTATWTRAGNWPVRLGTWGPSRPSSFYHSSWFNNIRPATLVEETVAPGQIGTFIFNASATKQGWYFEQLNLVAEGLTWFNDTQAGVYFYVVPPDYQWQFLGVSHSTSSVSMNPGETQTITVKAKNVGTTVWYRDAAWPVRLGTWAPSRPSVFSNGSWFGNVRPAQLVEETVAPGEIGTFAFPVFAPPTASGWYFERINLVAEGLMWLGDQSAGFYINVLSGYQWQFLGVSHSTSSVSMNPGETQTITLRAKNVGTTTWTKGGSWPVRLGTWDPGRTSSFYHSSWLGNIRPAVMAEETVAPGETGTFSFDISAPSEKGWHFERLNLVGEGLLWLNDTGAGFYIYVN